MLVGIGYGLCAGHQLMMQGLIAHPDVVRNLGDGAFKALHGTEGDQSAHGTARSHVDLVKREPVVHRIPVAVKDHPAVFQIQVDELSGIPAVVFFHQGIGQLVMAYGD